MRRTSTTSTTPTDDLREVRVGRSGSRSYSLTFCDRCCAIMAPHIRLPELCLHLTASNKRKVTWRIWTGNLRARRIDLSAYPGMNCACLLLLIPRTNGGNTIISGWDHSRRTWGPGQYNVGPCLRMTIAPSHSELWVKCVSMGRIMRRTPEL